MAKKVLTKTKASKKPLALTAKRVQPSLLTDIKHLIDSSRQRVAATVNSELTWLYWQIGRRIQQDILNNVRAEYGKRIVHTLSAQLAAAYGQGYTARNLFYMLSFAEAFPMSQLSPHCVDN